MVPWRRATPSRPRPRRPRRASEHQRAERADRGRPLALLRARRPDALRRRLRRPAAPARRRSRSSSPSCAPPTRRPRRSAARSRPSSPRSTTSSGWRASTTRSPTTSSSPGTPGWRATGVDDAGAAVRAQGRRPGDQPALRGRPAGPGAHPRRRPHRRGRHAQREDDRLGAAPADAAPTSSRCPALLEVRGEVFLPGRGVRAAQRVDDRRRQAGVRQPAQRRGRLAAPEGPAGHRDPRARHGLPRHRRARGLRAEGAVPRLRRARRLGAADLRRRSRCCRRSRRSRATSSTPASTATRSSPYEIDGVVVKVDDVVAAAPARLDQPGAAVGDRVQVPARGGQRQAALDPRSTPAAPAG